MRNSNPASKFCCIKAQRWNFVIESIADITFSNYGVVADPENSLKQITQGLITPFRDLISPSRKTKALKQTYNRRDEPDRLTRLIISSGLAFLLPIPFHFPSHVMFWYAPGASPGCSLSLCGLDRCSHYTQMHAWLSLMKHSVKRQQINKCKMGNQ